MDTAVPESLPGPPSPRPTKTLLTVAVVVALSVAAIGGSVRYFSDAAADAPSGDRAKHGRAYGR